MARVIVHIDLNAFFVRCEEIKDSSLIDKPVAIGHDGRGGIVSTCSYKAREFGVSSGMPMFQARQKCPELIIRPVDYRFYHALSHKFMSFVQEYSKQVEIASVDECYADFTETLKGVKDMTSFFREFQKKLYERTNLYCSIGVACTKFLAKMGSDYRKPNGLTIIHKKEIPTILYPLSVDKTFGIGKKTAPRLMNLGIKTIGDLVKKIDEDDILVKNITGKFFYTLKDWLHGKGDDKVTSQDDSDCKSIGASSTFMHDTDDMEDVKEMFEALSKEVSERLINEGKKGFTVQIVAKEAGTNGVYKVHNKSITLEKPIENWKNIYDTAIKLYRENYSSLVVRLVGVTVQKLIDPRTSSIQMSFFDFEDYKKESATKLLINDLNRKMKKPMLKRASEAIKK